MKRFAVVAVVALALVGVVVSDGFGQTAPGGKAPLAKEKSVSKLARPHQLLTGDVAAMFITQLVTAYKFVDTPMLAAYDTDQDKVAIMLIGEPTTVDGAKEVIEAFRTKALAPCLETLKTVHRMELEESDFDLGYFVGEKEEPFVEWINGEYKMH